MLTNALVEVRAVLETVVRTQLEVISVRAPTDTVHRSMRKLVLTLMNVGKIRAFVRTENVSIQLAHSCVDVALVTD